MVIDTSWESLSMAPDTVTSARSEADTARSNSMVRALIVLSAAAINEYGSATSALSPDPLPASATNAPIPSAIIATTAATSATGRLRPPGAGATVGTSSVSGNADAGDPVTAGPVGGANVEVMCQRVRLRRGRVTSRSVKSS